MTGNNLNELKSSRIKFLNISFNENVGTIFKTETPLSLNDNNILLDWICPNVDGEQEYYDDNTQYNGLIHFEEISSINNKIINNGLYLINFQYHRLWMFNILFNNNFCGIDVNDGCILINDCWLTLDNTNFNNNNGTFIVTLNREINNLNDNNISTNICI